MIQSRFYLYPDFYLLFFISTICSFGQVRNYPLVVTTLVSTVLRSLASICEVLYNFITFPFLLELFFPPLVIRILQFHIKIVTINVYLVQLKDIAKAHTKKKLYKDFFISNIYNEITENDNSI